jgi:ribonuclease G
MEKEIVINATNDEVRIAIFENSHLSEFLIEGYENERMLGNIYLGKIVRVIPGIKAAFVSIGQKQDAFLHFSDVGNKLEDYSALIGDDSDIDDSSDDDDSDLDDNEESIFEDSEPQMDKRINKKEISNQINPASQLQKGQEIIIQVIKEPIGNKGVRVTSEVSIPGRYLVLMPFDNKIGVSKRISNFKEKRRLRKIVRSILQDGFGVIIRTVAEGVDEDSLRQDLQQIINIWKKLEDKLRHVKLPCLLYKDMSMTSSVIRDLFDHDVIKVAIDSKKLYKEIKEYAINAAPSIADKIELYRSKEPILEHYKIEKEVEKLYSKKVYLKNGGYIYIEHTEAMVVIDVNSGRYHAQTVQELNSLKTNLEAAREIARQLRLRDIGGMIVVDFIDLKDEVNRKKIYDELKKEFKKDRAKSAILPMTDFGLVQITRQRVRQSLFHTVKSPCPFCGGSGVVTTKSNVISRIEKWIRNYSDSTGERRFELRVNPSVYNYMTEGFINTTWKFRLKFLSWITVIPDPTLMPDEVKVYSTKQERILNNF